MNEPIPLVVWRRYIAKSCISLTGTSAVIVVFPPPIGSIPRTLPLRLLSSPMISPVLSSGAVTASSPIGSSITGSAWRSPSLYAIDAAVLNAISEESTGWYEPSTSIAFRPTTGQPASTPFLTQSSRPFCTAGKKFLGTAPPKTFSSNTSVSLTQGSNSIHT